MQSKLGRRFSKSYLARLRGSLTFPSAQTHAKNTPTMRPFHYAFKVKDIETTRRFYIDILGCEEGRSTDSWIDFNFFGHQLSAHISDKFPDLDYCGKVDGISVPLPHFGCLLEIDEFKRIQERLEAAEINFVVKPQKRYQGKVGEQLTMFVLDFSENPIEFKAFLNNDEIFAGK